MKLAKQQAASHFTSPIPTPFSPVIISAYLLAGMATLLSIVYFDRSIAEFMHQQSRSNLMFEGFSKIPLMLEIIAATIVLMSFSKRYQTRLFHIRQIIILLAIFASIIRVGAKVLFGRTWPETWTNDNLSWISHGVESFHPFSLSNSFHSFPSGHALLTFAFASLFWYFTPQFRLLWIFCMAAVIIGQLGQNYHFLGDLLAGAAIGTLVCQLTINGYVHYFLAQKKAQN